MNQAESVVRVHGVLLATFPDNPTDQAIETLQTELLDQIDRAPPEGVVIDLSGVETVDSFFARMIAETTNMIDLMGAQTIVVGIQPSVAVIAVELGYDFGAVQKARNTDHALRLLGVERQDNG